MFGRKKTLNPSDFENTVNSEFKKLAAMSFCEKNNNTPEQGLELFWEDITRGEVENFYLNGKKIPFEITQEALKEKLASELGSQDENFLCHYSQRPMQYAAAAVTGIPKGADRLTPHAAKNFLSKAKKSSSNNNEAKRTVSIDYDKKEKAVHVKAIFEISFINFCFNVPTPEEQKNQDKVVEVKTDFRLLRKEEEVEDKVYPDKSKKGFMFVSLETPSALCRKLFAAPKAEVERSFSFSSSMSEIESQRKTRDEQQEPIEKGSVFWKIVKGAAVITALIGIGLLVAGFVYLLPPVALTLPYLGVVLSGSPLAFAGAGCLGAAGTGFLFNRAATSEWFMQKWRQVSLFWRGSAGVSTTLGVGAAVVGAVLFPPLIYAGLGLVLVTAAGHLLHILLQKPPEPEKPARLHAPSVSESFLFDERPVLSARNSVSSTTRSLLPSPLPDKGSSRARVGSITPDEESTKIRDKDPADKKAQERNRLFTPTAVKNLNFTSPASALANEDRPPLDKKPSGSENTSSDDARQPRLSSLSPSRFGGSE